MKLKRFYLVASVMLLALMASCNQDAVESVDDSFFGSATRANGKPLEIDYSALDTYYFVTDKDVESYIHFKKLLAEGEKREFEVREVVPLGLNDKATLAYLLNYNDGWEIIAADKRAQRVLATDEKGSFDMKEAPEAVVAWIENLEMQVLYLRSCADRPEWASDETWEKMLESIDFWRAINAEEDFIMEHMGDTRGHGGLIPDPIPIDSIIIDPMVGHWELAGITNIGTETVTRGHIIDTQWDQSYNQYCPFKTNGVDRAPAGSAPVAGAQLEYYLHGKIGKPVYCPSDIYCAATVGNVQFGTNMYIVSNSTSLWSGMNGNSISIAKMIAGMGIKVGVTYGNTSTTASIANLQQALSNDGILCDNADYSVSVVTQELLDDKPVVASVYGMFSGESIPEEYCMIIDNYKGTADKYRYNYLWVVDVPGDGTVMHPYSKDEIVIDYESTVINQIGMNWGRTELLNGRFFAPNANWQFTGVVEFWWSSAKILYNFR